MAELKAELKRAAETPTKPKVAETVGDGGMERKGCHGGNAQYTRGNWANYTTGQLGRKLYKMSFWKFSQLSVDGMGNVVGYLTMTYTLATSNAQGFGH